MNKVILLLIICILFTKSHSQCDTDKNYKYFQALIQNEKDNIQKLFDGILEKYGDVTQVLKELLKKANSTVNRAELELSHLEGNNRNINENNKDSSVKIDNIVNSIKNIESELDKIKFNKKWSQETEDAEISANKTFSLIDSEDITNQEKELQEWKHFLNELNEYNYYKDIMNLPHSISDELYFLEDLLAKEIVPDCFEKLHNDLKLLFIELAHLFDLSSYENDINNIKDNAAQNKKDADDILSNTTKFLDKERELENIYHLTNETLSLAEELDKLKGDIEKLTKNNNEIITERLKKLQEEHEAEIEELYKKYNVKEGKSLLNKLKKTKQQIENFDIDNIEKDIDNYIRDLNYYTCILEKCESGTETIDVCEEAD